MHPLFTKELSRQSITKNQTHYKQHKNTGKWRDTEINTSTPHVWYDMTRQKGKRTTYQTPNQEKKTDWKKKLKKKGTSEARANGN